MLAAAGAAAQDGAGSPLAITVNPSGYESAPETLEEKLARRERESDYLFRHICRSCGSRQGEATATFAPQDALDASRRSR